MKNNIKTSPTLSLRVAPQVGDLVGFTLCGSQDCGDRGVVIKSAIHNSGVFWITCGVREWVQNTNLYIVARGNLNV